MNFVDKQKFSKIILSIGFKETKDFETDNVFKYGKYIIALWNSYFKLYNGSEWIHYRYDSNDIYTLFNKEFRSLKLKNILK